MDKKRLKKLVWLLVFWGGGVLAVFLLSRFIRLVMSASGLG